MKQTNSLQRFNAPWFILDSEPSAQGVAQRIRRKNEREVRRIKERSSEAVNLMFTLVASNNLI